MRVALGRMGLDLGLETLTDAWCRGMGEEQKLGYGALSCDSGCYECWRTM